MTKPIRQIVRSLLVLLSILPFVAQASFFSSLFGSENDNDNGTPTALHGKLHAKQNQALSAATDEVNGKTVINITNNSNKAEDFANATISFQSPNKAIWWVNVDGLRVAPESVDCAACGSADQGGLVSVKLKAVTWGASDSSELLSGQSFTLDLGDKVIGITDIKINDTHAGGDDIDNNPNKKIKLTLAAAPNDSVASQKATVQITGPSYDKTFKFNKGWDSTKTVKDLTSGEYTVYVEPVHPLNEKAKKDKYVAYAGSADVAKFTLNNDNKTQKVTITYHNTPVEIGAIQVKLNQEKPTEDIAAPEVFLTKVGTSENLPTQALPWSGKAKFDGLTAGDQYEVHAQTFTFNGSDFIPKVNKQTITVTKGVANVKVTYTEKKPAPAEVVPVHVTVNGLPANAPQTTLTFVGMHNKQEVRYEHAITPNFNQKFDDLFEGTYDAQLSPATVVVGDKQYVATVSPEQLTVKKGVQNNVTVTYAEHKPAPLPTGDAKFAPFKMMTQNFSWSYQKEGPNLDTLAKESGNKNYILAFVLPYREGYCEPSWDTTLPVDIDKFPSAELYKPAVEGIKTRIADIQKQGGIIGISFGGENGGSMASGCHNPQDLAAAYLKVIDTYKPAYLDFDVEGAELGNMAANARRLAALKEVLKIYPDLKIQFTVPTNGDGFNPTFGLDFNKMVIASGIPVYRWNLMSMAFYAQYDNSKTMGENLVATAHVAHQQLLNTYQAEGKQAPADLWKHMGITSVVGVDYDTMKNPTHIVKLADINYLYSQLGDKLGLFSFWSADRDTQNTQYGHSCVGNLSPQTDCSGIEQQPYAFSKEYQKLLSK